MFEKTVPTMRSRSPLDESRSLTSLAWETLSVMIASASEQRKRLCESSSLTVHTSAFLPWAWMASMASAVALLGHPYRLTGTVLHGRGLGHTLGFPTANLDFPDALLAPAFGVYACRAFLPDAVRTAVVNLGVRPTVDRADGIHVEAWIQDYDGDLYGRELTLEFLTFLRPERRFPDLDALRAQVLQDGEQARAAVPSLPNI